MNKGELVDTIAKGTGLPKNKCNEVLGVILDSIVEEAKKGEKVTLVGFGTFLPYKRKETTGVNPRTQEKIKIPAKTVLKFKPSDTIKL